MANKFFHTCLVLVVLCAAGAGVTRVSAQFDARAADYVIGPQDILAISVFNQPTLSGHFTVETDGSITFPLIGVVKVGGLSVLESQRALWKRLSDGFLIDPQVNVSIEQYRSQRVFVVGEVRTPAAYPLSGETTLVELLARAGSLTAEASGEVVIVRPPAGKAVTGPVLPNQNGAAEITRIDFKNLEGGITTQNVTLRDGDTLFVPRGGRVFVFGEVRNPGAYIVQKNTTVLQALSLAGGVTDRAATNRIKVSRIVDGKKKEISVKLTDAVTPDDTIIVTQRFF